MVRKHHQEREETSRVLLSSDPLPLCEGIPSHFEGVPFSLHFFSAIRCFRSRMHASASRARYDTRTPPPFCLRQRCCSYLDNSNTGFVNVYKFSEFMKGFGPIKEAVKNVRRLSPTLLIISLSSSLSSLVSRLVSLTHIRSSLFLSSARRSSVNRKQRTTQTRLSLIQA